MRNLVVFLLCNALLASCASITNGDSTEIVIKTTKQSRLIIHSDTINSIDNQVKFSVQRSKDPINIIAETDSLKKVITVESKNSFAYYSNILCNYGLGMLFDKDNPKRYSYPGVIYINSSDTVNEYFPYSQLSNKGAVDCHFSLPHVNSFYLRPDNEGKKSNTGFWGISVGVDYYHDENQFLNMMVGGGTDFFLPFPGAVDLFGEHELMSTIYFSVSNNHKTNWLSFGYGLSAGINNWKYRDYGQHDSLRDVKPTIVRSSASLGLIFSTYYRATESFNIGILYRPTFIRFSKNNIFQYEHLISIDFAWKITIMSGSAYQ